MDEDLERAIPESQLKRGTRIPVNDVMILLHEQYYYYYTTTME